MHPFGGWKPRSRSETVEDMHSPTAAPRAGWFPDPAGSGGERWWSGETWTEHVRAVSAPPPPPPAAPVACAVAEPEAPTYQPAAVAEPVAPSGGFVTPGAGTSNFADLLARAEARDFSASAPRHDAQPAGYGQHGYGLGTPPAGASPAPPLYDTAAHAAAPHQPAVAEAPAGFTPLADPGVADRYRQAAAAETAAEAATPAMADTMGASPNLPGWQGRPLPGDTSADRAPGTFPPLPHTYEPRPTTSSIPVQAPVPLATIEAGSNKVAALALSAGIGSLGAITLLFVGSIPVLTFALGLGAIVLGIVGLVIANRTGDGAGKAAGGLLLGSLTSIVTVITVGAALLTPSYQWDDARAEREIIADAADWGIDLATLECPVAPDLTPGNVFSCRGADTFFREVEILVFVEDDGEFSWDVAG